MSLEIFHCGDNLGDAGLVVSSEQGGAVGDYQVLAQIVEELGEFIGGEEDLLLLVECDSLAVVVLDDAGLDMLAAHVGGSVEVSDEAYDGHLAVCVGRESGHEIAIVVEGDFAEPHLFEALLEEAGEDHLSGSGGGHVGAVVTLGVEGHIGKESVGDIHDIL